MGVNSDSQFSVKMFIRFPYEEDCDEQNNEEEKRFLGGEAENMDAFGLHPFLCLPLVLSVKMLSIPVMKSYLLI